ncbi:D-glycero-beta-D-manno-heptose-7-phosphate kinase [Sphingomonas pruni]|uniref:D-glycero-beta-D-manno-heptose-7-phosphate kinase n=1 Tax=Sphingomonas pruni TaxID=40683 RepID=UPI000829FD61|nr:D-glycero-beta-D-manno-heptose-7-phosphate kinase [Sphingomonas pruni]
MNSFFPDPALLTNARVLVVGDLMLDRFRYGSVSRISPEAPVPVLHVNREQKMLGGAGNVLANIASLGGQAGLIAVIGTDEAGRLCSEMIFDKACDSTLLVSDPARPTTLKTRFISGSQQLLRCDEEDFSQLPEAIEDRVVANFDRAIGDYDVVALSDYAKGLLTDRVLRHAISRCRELGKPVIVDPKRRDFAIYAGASVIKPNRSELAAFSGLPCRDLTSSATAAALAMEVTGGAILLTLSEDGMALFRPGHEMSHLHATATEVFDVSGAGDTALAIFCAGIASGLTMEDAALVANAGAGTVVRKLGTATLSSAELAHAVGELDRTRSAPSAICTAEDAAQMVQAWKREGLRVGFTNGCFDIVHAGHVQILRQARACCDRLVVGLNSDTSVSQLKGPSRPVQSEASRAAVLAAMGAVDLVVVFDEDTPLSLIERLLPTDLIKGADYREDQVVGAEVVKAHGGRVHLIELLPGLSTTGAIARIKQGQEFDTPLVSNPENASVK